MKNYEAKIIRLKVVHITNFHTVMSSLCGTSKNDQHREFPDQLGRTGPFFIKLLLPNNCLAIAEMSRLPVKMYMYM